MYQFLKKHNLPELTQEETDNLNKPKYIKEIESLIIIPKGRVLGSNMFPGVFYQIFKEKIIKLLWNLFQRTEVYGVLLHSLYKTRSTLMSKPDNCKKTKLQNGISHEHKYKNPQQNISK